MINTLKLQAKMKEKAFTIKTLSKAVDLSVTGLFNKIHNKREFTVTELQKIVKALELNSTEMQNIFFT